jgi:demethylmenaquinone methyltransferase/2-methoxy-6-polyprenyl-1,4-benzoquinol methylase
MSQSATTDSIAAAIRAPAANPHATLTGKSKARYVQGMFSRIARRYDLMNFIMSFGQDGRWRARVAAHALARRTGRAVALDVGTGTGLIARELARRGARVVALDLTLDMMLVGMARGIGRDGSVCFLAGDTLSLPFRDAAFDCVTTGFTMRNVADISAAFTEMRRVLKPGGRLVCLEVGRPDFALGKLFHSLYTRRVVPLLGRLVAGDADAYTYLPSSMSRFPAPSELARIISGAGLRFVRYRQFTFGAVAIHLAIR